MQLELVGGPADGKLYSLPGDIQPGFIVVTFPARDLPRYLGEDADEPMVVEHVQETYVLRPDYVGHHGCPVYDYQPK
ncbi:hypothetical protein QEH44_gp28 [Arthrobacter phage Shambre1]|uniref:Uncharacterized protein n=1 Tax=Arthrobacter phage Shambre1 TaxID=2927284 RepID=A0A977PSE1_9CAUD|nr:hypothetical protein QEH44_gp28 [Arthrobacter phage Shambre1]UXE04765.1 hypothetical protein SEA_SHAMBRE1_28 [Arthrobacter phage Shambre1]